MAERKRIVVVGATSAIAEQCSRLWLRDPVDMVLVGRNGARLERIAADLRVRNAQANIRTVTADFLAVSAIKATVDAIAAQQAVDIVLIAHGALPDQQECETDLAACRDALEINGVSPILHAEAFAGHMARANKGVIALIGSVAGDRGRRSNYIYGAAKGMIARYAQGLQHRLAGTGVAVVLIKPGPTDTPMTAFLKAKGAKLASANAVAQIIVRAIEARRSVVYAPWKWRIIMLVIQHLPSFIFNKLRI